MFVGTIWLHPVLLPHVVWGVGGNGKINGVQRKLPRASQLLGLLITDSSGTRVPRYPWIIQAGQHRIEQWSQWVTGEQALHIEFKHSWKPRAQEGDVGMAHTGTELTLAWHTQGQSHRGHSTHRDRASQLPVIPQQPLEQKLCNRLSGYQCTSSGSDSWVNIPSWHPTPAHRLTFRGLI